MGKTSSPHVLRTSRAALIRVSRSGFVPYESSVVFFQKAQPALSQGGLARIFALLMEHR